MKSIFSFNLYGPPADAANLNQVQAVIARAKRRFGQINCVLHTAGIADYEGVIQRRTREMTERVMAPKIMGTLVLDTILKDIKPDFFVLFSSIGNILYKTKFGRWAIMRQMNFLKPMRVTKHTKMGYLLWLLIGMIGRN
jgi:NAD(P)-dependent dehydrogenase (short-subunit alcohol dehydrogenase family)